jgi:sphingolipid delta-4 desaturase
VAVALRTRLLAPGVHTADSGRTARFALPPHLQTKKQAMLGVSVLCHAVAWAVWGWRAALVSLCSVGCKSSRFDVVGWGQDLAEHNPDEEHPTNSTYTLWNWLFCNTGYHNEHHTFPTVPGCYLPRLTRAAPQNFKSCENTTSYPALWARWALGGFRSFRLNEYQVHLAASGRCDKAKDKGAKAS